MASATGQLNDAATVDRGPTRRLVRFPTAAGTTFNSAAARRLGTEESGAADDASTAIIRSPPPLTPQGGSLPPQYPDWRMGGLPAATDEVESPPRRGRNRFLMIVLGILLGCLILCVGLFIYSITPSGQDFFEDVGTSIADIATESADNS